MFRSLYRGVLLPLFDEPSPSAGGGTHIVREKECAPAGQYSDLSAGGGVGTLTGKAIA